MNALSLFSGIGGFDVALARCGVEVVGQVEIDPAAQAVLRERFPGVPIFGESSLAGVPVFGDIANAAGLEAWLDTLPEPVDLITAGWPCQDLSVAGKRAGLAGARSGLFFDLARVVGQVRPPWILLENVPGLLSQGGGQDFAIVLEALAELGYFVEWSVLDAQHFGVPQRRRRVFIVGHLGGPPPFPVLFERQSRGGDPAKGRAAGKVAAAIPASGAGTSRTGNERTEAELLVEQAPGVVSATAKGAGWYTEGLPQLQASDDNGTNHLVAPDVSAPLYSNAQGGQRTTDVEGGALVGVIQDGREGVDTKGQNGLGMVEGDVGYTLDTLATQAVAFEARVARNGRGAPEEVVPPLKAQSGQTGKGDSVPMVMADRMLVRRLTPLECARLQGFPDSWLDLDPELSDSAKYRLLGNAVATPVVWWIAQRLVAVARGEDPDELDLDLAGYVASLNP